MLKKISFKQLVVNNDQMFALSEYGDVFEYVYHKESQKSFWIKLPTEYDDGAPTVTTTVPERQNDIELGQKSSAFWDVYEQEQKRKQQR